MRILLEMTCHAFGSRIRIDGIGAMTGFTCGARMGADQGEVGEVMIEKARFKVDDSGIATFVIGVTNGTVVHRGACVFAVEAIARFDIATDSLVTGHAQFLLGYPGAFAMALRALAFYVLMHRRHRTRHHQFFEDRSPCHRRENQCEEDGQRRCSRSHRKRIFSTIPHQYQCTAMMCTITETTSSTKNGTCTVCQRLNRRSYARNSATRRTCLRCVRR